MFYTFQKMTEENAQIIVQWRYKAPYNYYNPDPRCAKENTQRLLIPHNPYYSINNANQGLTGFCCFGSEGQVSGGDYRAEALDIGLGLHPELTGLGKGRDFLNAILDFATQTFSPSAFRVTVAEFNSRAIRLYENSEFERVGRFQSRSDGRMFIQMATRPYHQVIILSDSKIRSISSP